MVQLTSIRVAETWCGNFGGFEFDFCLEGDPPKCEAERARREARYFDQEILPGERVQFHLDLPVPRQTASRLTVGPPVAADVPPAGA
jgi:hypothetical protein